MANLTAPGVPSIHSAARQFVEFVTSCCEDGSTPILVAHNGARFDFRFVVCEFARAGLEVPPGWWYLDTLVLGEVSGLRQSVANLKLGE